MTDREYLHTTVKRAIKSSVGGNVLGTQLSFELKVTGKQVNRQTARLVQVVAGSFQTASTHI